MKSVLDILSGGFGSTEDYLARDPLFRTGISVSQIQRPAATNNLEAFLGPVLQGLLAGTLTGIGKDRAKQQAYDEYSSSPYLKALEGTRTDETPFGPMPLKYGAEEAPEDWTPEIGKNDLMLQLLAGEQEREAAIEEQKANAKIQEFLMSRGAMLDPEGGIVPLTKLTDIEADAEAAKEAAKIKAKLEAESDALGYNPKAEEETDKLRKEFSALPEVKNFSQVEKTANIITKAIEDPSAVSDQELTRYSILLIEPGMAVREGEQAAIANSASIPAAWKGELQRASKGGSRLGPEVREGMKRLAMRAYEGHKQQYDEALGFYKKQAEQKKLDPDRISYIGASEDPTKIFGEAIPTYSAAELAAAGYSARDIESLRAQGKVK